jgi:2-polyprenyl-6-methoxyphenol hydroxylase-like FAD-dependent oxidoreductase
MAARSSGFLTAPVQVATSPAIGRAAWGEGLLASTAVLPERAEVLVVGAGPTGLLIAAELCRRGIDVLLIDHHDRPLTWDRATVVHPRSLEVFDALGVAEELIDAGVLQSRVRLYSDGEQLGVLDLASSGSRYPFNLGVSEEATERILAEHVRAHGGEVVRGATLVALEKPTGAASPDLDRPPEVAATIEHAGVTSTVHASWVVGCDGFHSATRHLAGIDEEVRDEDRSWVVFDATLEPWVLGDTDTRAHFDTPLTIMTALPGGRWRIYVHTNATGSAAVSSSLEVLRRYDGRLRYVGVDNVAPFTCYTRIATRFRAGRVLLAGDAAHVCSPAQGHGMNSGVQDAENLAWKLALVVRGVAADAILDSYEAERRPIAERHLLQGTDSEAIIALSDPSERAERDAAIRARLADPTTRHVETVAEAELDADLRSSPIVLGEPGPTVTAGALLPQTVEVTLADGRPSLLARAAVGTGHTLLLCAGDDVPERQVDQLTAELIGAIAHRALIGRLVVVHGSEVRTNHDDQPDPRSTTTNASTEHVYIDGAGLRALEVRNDAVAMLVVRPDGWVGARADTDHLARLAAYGARLLDA